MPIPSTAIASPAAKSLRFSTYAGAKDVKPRDFECVWSDVVEHQSNHLVTPCEPCPGKNCSHKAGSAHNFAELAPGTTRATRNVVRVHAGVFDLDHGVIDDVKGSMRLLKAEGIEAVLSSTHSHTPSTPRLRLTLSLSRPAMASEWPALWGAINARFELHADEQAKDPARLYYDPTVPEGVKPLIWVNAGVPLDVDAVLASAPKEITGLKPTRSGDEWRGMLEIIGDGRRNSTLTAVAGALMRHAPSLSPDLAFELVLALNEARCRPPLPAKTVATIADSIARKQGARS